jgi:CRP-like cAMP-binding protein
VSLRRLSSLATLTPCEEDLIRKLRLRTLSADSILSGADEQCEQSWFVLSGWCARVKSLAEGRRQILHLVLPGDLGGAGAANWAGDRLPAITLTQTIIAEAAPLKAALRAGAPQHGGLIEACQKAAWREQTCCLNAIVRLGQQTAYERLAHLLLEIDERLAAVGLVNRRGFELPVAQSVIANTLGLSLVHVRRTLRLMCKQGVIAFGPGRIELLRRDVLAAAANFSNVVNWIQ